MCDSNSLQPIPHKAGQQNKLQKAPADLRLSGPYTFVFLYFRILHFYISIYYTSLYILKSGYNEDVIDCLDCSLEVIIGNTDDDIKLARTLVDHLDIDIAVSKS